MLDLPELLAPKNKVIGAMRMSPVSRHPLKFRIRKRSSMTVVPTIFIVFAGGNHLVFTACHFSLIDALAGHARSRHLAQGVSMGILRNLRSRCMVWS